MKLGISYVLRYAVLKPMGVVFLGHKVVYESKSLLQSIFCCFPSIFLLFLKCAHIQKMAWVLQAIWYTVTNGGSNVSIQLLPNESDFCLLFISIMIKIAFFLEIYLMHKSFLKLYRLWTFASIRTFVQN